ncbi:hypothetical protein M409DRAFT_69148 [Zasmidium cellare ATCC 36951]|uniref:NmrA-like domain-containing protein n=1 Tax=Zasmidium cellare ATCC 36951 TaxID=1080233 RepID=A0A6A6C9M0_ZASCE|nr:uncharacterized protein M409DRAFT_69148 [Zasmidium cellare ATCC 36951]KAF2162592.1 hypothetical protein M409DRAFT_69148 [Zasmidium cellare ATCC 36951]
MPNSNHIKRLAIVGAGGNVGASTIRHLLQINPDISVTIISRNESTATFSSSSRIIVRKGSYDDASFLGSALHGNEMAMFALSLYAEGLQPRLIDLAAKVKWIIPNEYGADGMNEAMLKSNQFLHGKAAARKQIEDLGMKWIGVATNPWTELCILNGLFGFKAPQRTATFYSGSGSFNGSSMQQIGRGIAQLISLPTMSTSNPTASLAHYANRFVYISSFLLNQNKIFESLKRATHTSDEDWTVKHSSIEERIKDGQEKIAEGDFNGMAEMMFASYMGEGLGGDYQSKHLEDKEALGLEDEDLDEIVKAALASY